MESKDYAASSLEVSSKMPIEKILYLDFQGKSHDLKCRAKIHINSKVEIMIVGEKRANELHRKSELKRAG